MDESGGPRERATRGAKSRIFMGKTNPSAPAHKQQSMILVPLDTPGVKIVRLLTVVRLRIMRRTVHAEIQFESVRRSGGEHAAGRGARI